MVSSADICVQCQKLCLGGVLRGLPDHALSRKMITFLGLYAPQQFHHRIIISEWGGMKADRIRRGSERLKPRMRVASFRAAHRPVNVVTLGEQQLRKI